MRALVRGLVAAGVVAAGVVAGALVATPTAASASGAEFGHHVSACAQSTGLDGTHNPGMHRGFSGWTPMHEC